MIDIPITAPGKAYVSEIISPTKFKTLELEIRLTYWIKRTTKIIKIDAIKDMNIVFLLRLKTSKKSILSKSTKTLFKILPQEFNL